MYDVTSPIVYVTERAEMDEHSAARMERMMERIDAREVRRVSDDELYEIVANDPAFVRARIGPKPDGHERIVVFNGFTWPTDDDVAAQRERFPKLAGSMFLGGGHWGLRDRQMLRERLDGVCQTAYELHCATGCLHGCHYCSLRAYVLIMLNLEQYVERLEAFLPTVPWLKLFKYDNITDQICFEPEYGASKLMVECFAKQPDRYLLLYTKSDNVDHLLDLDHNGHTIVSWSMSCDRVSREVEEFTPMVDKRIEAAEKCQAAGYTVRARFSPIVPVADWREQYGATLRDYLSRVRPDVVTLDVVGWMTATNMTQCLPVEEFDPEFRDEVHALVEAGDPKRGKPFNPDGKHVFSHELRAKIIRFCIDTIRECNPRQRVAICMETPEMWAEFGDELGMNPANYVCCCGPTSVPGHPMLS